MSMRRWLVLIGLLAALAALAAPAARPAGAQAAPTQSPPATPGGAAPAAQSSSGQSANAGTPIPVPPSENPPAGRRLSANQVLAIAAALPKMKAVRAKYRGSYGGAYLKLPFHWQVSYFSRDGKKEIGQVTIDDLSGRVLEQWTGFQVPWTMARGYPGAFGRHVNALYIWLPLCVLFVVPFLRIRRPFSLLHLDLLVLVFFSVSLAFFNHGRIYASVPLAYPPLLYLLARMLALSRPGRPRTSPGGLRLLVPASWLAVGVVFLIGFRIALNVTDSNVIDVGYAGVIGAQRIADGKPLYGSFPKDNEHGDTYGPVAYEAYLPFQQIFGWSGGWDSLPAAHAAAIAFDLLAVALIFLLGRRVRGPTLGIALAYAWVSYPFTLFALECNSNDTLVAVLVLATLLLAGSAPARGALAALAGLTKFAPLALAPLLATQGSWRRPPARSDPDAWSAAGRSPRAQARIKISSLVIFAGAFLALAALACIPALTHDSLHTIYQRTLAYQADRGSPFSIWGLYGGLGGLQAAVQVAAVVLAITLALVRQNRNLAGLAAAGSAVMIAAQLGIDHWFYLYIPWFFGLVMLALLGSLSPAPAPRTDAASAPARSSRPVVAASRG